MHSGDRAHTKSKTSNMDSSIKKRQKKKRKNRKKDTSGNKFVSLNISLFWFFFFRCVSFLRARKRPPFTHSGKKYLALWFLWVRSIDMIHFPPSFVLQN